MKTKLIIATVLAANLVVLWGLAHRYEFRTGMDGAIIWRCNNFTGKAEHSTFGESKWIVVSSPKPKISAEDFLDGKIDSAGVPTTGKNSTIPDWAKGNTASTDEFGGILVTNKTQTK